MVSNVSIIVPITTYVTEPKKYKITKGYKHKVTKEYIPPVYGMYQPMSYVRIPKDCKPEEVVNYSNKKIPQEFTLCTHIRKGKDYPYNSEKRGWALNIES